MRNTRPRRSAVRARRAATALLSAALATTLITTAVAPAAATPSASSTSSAAASLRVRPATLSAVRVPGTTPMSAAAVDLDAYGYTEREFFASGTAHRFRGATAGALTTAQVIDDGWKYRSRVLVRTPERNAFNGTLVVEWTNVTLGQDADFVFGEAHRQLLRDGYAVAVVSAQTVGVQRLTTWSPERYAGLSVEAPNEDPQGGAPIDSCRQGACDPLSWDVMTQVAKALQQNAGAHRPLPGLKVREVVATGQSQSAVRLTTYYNTIQPLYRFFDGFVFWDRATQLRADVATPGVSVNSEALASAAFPAVTTGRWTRAWDVAGSTHGSLDVSRYMDRMFLRDRSLAGPSGPLSFTQVVEPSCTVLPPFSRVRNGQVIAGATSAVRAWIRTGRPAARSVQFARDAQGAPVRGADGQVQGGVRISGFRAPTAENTSTNGTTFPCSISGSHRDYTDDELEQRYGTHREYVRQVDASMRRALRGGYVLPADVRATVRAAQRSDVAR